MTAKSPAVDLITLGELPMDVSLAAGTAKRRGHAIGVEAGRVWLFIAAVAAASGGIWAFNFVGFGPFAVRGGSALPWWALAIVFYLAETWVVHLQFRKQAHTLSLIEVGLVFGLFFASPAALLTAQVVGSALALSLHRRQKPVKFAFNLAELSLCTGIAFAIFHSLGGVGGTNEHSWLAALLAAAGAHTVGIFLVFFVIAVAEGTLTAPQLPRTFAISLVGVLATACVGLVGVELATSEPVALLLLVLPALACGFAFRGYVQQREQREHVEFLYESMQATHGAPEFGLAVGQLLVAARRLLRADYAEIVLLAPTPDEPVLRSVSGASGELLMHSEALSPVDELAIKQAGAADRATLLARRREAHQLDGFLATRKLSDAVFGCLCGEERVFGFLLVGDRVGDFGTFSEDDLALFETFARHASVLIENGRLERSLAQVTELKEELRDQAYHDGLTGLPNRVFFTDRVRETLARESAEGTTQAVLFLDLDRFKIVNDSWGHAVGDELLVQVAERIRHAVRPADTPARIGGDEFAVLLEKTDAPGAERAAQRVADALSAKFSVSGREASVHASIGIALTGPHAMSAEELLRNADIAMYKAKSDGNRRWALYEPVLHRRLSHRHELASELEGSVERGEIVVHYQPAVSLADGSIQAFEALARWHHPERGLLLPGDFLGVAEEVGLMNEIGNCVIEQAFRCASEWQDALPEAGNVGLWINLAPAEIIDEHLIENFERALTRTHLDVHRLTVEITESSVIRDEHNALRAMHRLRDLGAQLSIDDFGTGYSSLSRLAEFPIEMLKIPKPFIDRLTSDQAQTSFVDAILRLAGSLGLRAVGEGIEHLAQAQRLRELGCELGQGYYFSPPIAADEVLRLLRAGAADGLASPLAATSPIPRLRVVA